MQSKPEIEEWYKDRDPWGYETNPEDLKRKEVILGFLSGKGFERALDIGAGEGFITGDLPASELHAIEWSDIAAGRLPAHVKRIYAPKGKYDLVVATGVLYGQYDWQQITKWILSAASGLVLTSNIKSWEINKLPRERLLKELEFPYREYIQHLCLYDFSTP